MRVKILLLFFLYFTICQAEIKLSNGPSGKFLLVTDLHIDDSYDTAGNMNTMCHRASNTSEKAQNETPVKRPGKYGSHNCDAPMALVEFMLTEAKKQIPDPDYIIWTGDTGAHVQYDNARLLRTLDGANKAIRRNFPDTVVIPVLGNHESVPGNDFPDNEIDIYAGIFDQWKPWIGEDAKETFLKGGYYRFNSPLDNSTFIVLNTNIYYVWNSAINNFTNPDDPSGQLAFLEKELEMIANNNSYAHILAHVPIGAYEMYPFDEHWHPEMPKRYNEQLFKLFTKYAQSIRWMLFGHLHTDTFRILKDDGGKPVQRIFLSPSITPMFDLNNPAFRIFEYNTTNMDIEDIKTYYVDLDALNENGPKKVEATLEYSMRQAYGLRAPLSAETMNGLLEELKQNTTAFDEYAIYNTVQWNKKQLNESDRAVHLCVLEFVDYDRLERCLHGTTASSASLAKFSLGTLCLAAVLPFFLMQFL